MKHCRRIFRGCTIPDSGKTGSNVAVMSLSAWQRSNESKLGKLEEGAVLWVCVITGYQSC